jgi:AraC-like DNA-binding protein
MDPFEDVVSAMGVESSLYVRMHFSAPWGVTFDTGYQARLVMVARGGCWMTAEGMEPILLKASDCLIIKAGTEFSMQDERSRPLLACSEIFSTIDGRTVRHGGGGPVVEMVSARLSFDPLAGEPLMALLPNLVHVRLGDAEAQLLQTTLHLIGMETSEDGLGAGVVIGRLTDVLFVQTVRSWFSADAERATGWIAGLKNRQLASAIKAMHNDLGRPWTVDRLAREAGLSRSGFASAFKSITGETPLGYLTNWRIYRAKALLREGRSVVEAATSVGYDSETAFSRAFKRLEGIAPGAWRRDLHAQKAHPSSAKSRSGQMASADT